MRRVAALIGVLSHLCLANRLATHEDVVSSLKTDTADVASLFTADVIAAFENAAVDEEEHTQQWCTRLSAQQNRTFHFELAYENGDRTAMELVRHPRDPVIRFHRGQTWSVRLLRTPDRWSGEIEESLEWTPVVPDETGEPRVDEHGNMIVSTSAPLVIDIRKDLAYIKRRSPSGETPTGIEFGFLNGNTQIFAGGLYYPENAMKRSLVRAFHQREREVRRATPEGEEPANVSTLNRHAAGREIAANGGKVVRDTTVSIVESIYSAGKFSAISAFAFSFLPIIGSSPFALGAAFTAATTGPAGLIVGVTWAAAFTLPTSIIGAIHTWRHERREISMTASEKIFEKLSCHRMIGVCEGAELVGRDAVLAFAGRPDGDVLIPVNGDVDVISRTPLPPVVGWGIRVNNSGNIECIDSRVWGN